MNLNHIAIAFAASGALCGCIAAYPERDLRFGQAVISAREAQTLNPQAGPTRDPSVVSGIDGRAAKETMDRYVDSFKAPPPTVNVFNIGGSLAGQ
jgi:hypothetical protein